MASACQAVALPGSGGRRREPRRLTHGAGRALAVGPRRSYQAGMTILRTIWRLLVAVKDALVLLLLLLFFVGLWGALQFRSAVTVPNGSALVVDLAGVIVDQAREPSPAEFLSGASIVPEIEAAELAATIRHAAGDARIKALVLQMDDFLGAGEANLQSIAGAMKTFRASGKPVYAYATAYLDDGYYLAAQANEAWLNPLGAVLLTGPGGSGLYFKEALDKLAVTVNVFRVGAFKSAVEPFIQSAPSPEAREAEQALVDALWSTYVTGVQEARPGIDVNAYIAQLPQRVRAEDGDLARAALASKLVDKVGTFAAFGREARKLVGAPTSEEAPGSFNQVDYTDYRRSLGSRLSGAGGGPAVGLVYVSGTIVDGEAPPGEAGSDTLSALIEDALTDDGIKALVVRIDSPGGSVLASEKIRQALLQAKTRGIPVVASLGPVAASGGYWVATAADEIIAQPSTITGSIGVFAIIPSFERTLAELGVNAAGVRSTPLSGEPDVLAGLSPESRELLQLSVEDIYRRFVSIVATARKLPPERVEQVAQGRVWAGTAAQSFGLIDRFGGLDAAVAAAAKRAGLGDSPRTVDVEVAPWLPLQFLQEFGGSSATAAPSAQRDGFSKLARVGEMRAAAALSAAHAAAVGPRLQALCLACAAHQPGPSASSVGGASLGWQALLTSLNKD
jgi:protease-4